jgi:hypothetical protein
MSVNRPKADPMEPEQAMEYRQTCNLRLSYVAVIEDFQGRNTKVPKSLRKGLKRISKQRKELEAVRVVVSSLDKAKVQL